MAKMSDFRVLADDFSRNPHPWPLEMAGTCSCSQKWSKNGHFLVILAKMGQKLAGFGLNGYKTAKNGRNGCSKGPGWELEGHFACQEGDTGSKNPIFRSKNIDHATNFWTFGSETPN